MAEQDIPNRAANMEKAEGDRDEARDPEQPVARRPHPDDPTRVEDQRTSDAGTIVNAGLAGGRPQGGPGVTPERARREPDDRNPVMPDDEATLRTEI
jgi:hypothetical protein